MDDDLFVDLHTQAVKSLGISMEETTTYDDGSAEILSTVTIKAPPEIYMPRLETRLFHGDWSLTSDAAIQSACFNALVYLQKVNMLIIDGIHSDELKNCQRKLLAANSWVDAFQQRINKLQAELTTLTKEKQQALPTYNAPVGNPFMPAPNCEEATNNRKKRKLLLDLQHKQEHSVNQTHLPWFVSSSSENMSVVTNLTDGLVCRTKNHMNPANAMTHLQTPPSITKPVALSAKSASLDSKVRKSLFQNSGNKGKSPELEDKVEPHTAVNWHSSVGAAPLSKEGKP